MIPIRPWTLAEKVIAFIITGFLGFVAVIMWESREVGRDQVLIVREIQDTQKSMVILVTDLDKRVAILEDREARREEE